MRKTIAFVFVLLASHGNAQAIGGVVTDPTSYSYYVNIIKQAEDQLKNGMDQLNMLTTQTDTLFAMKNELEGSYNRVVGLPERLKAERARLDQLKPAIERQATALTTNNGSLSDGTADPWIDISKSMDGIWCDPRDAGCNPSELRAAQYSTRQHIYKDSMANAEDSLRKEAGHLKALNDLSYAIDHTANLKDASDLSNRFLMELLLGQREMIRLLAYMAQAAAVTEYHGVTAQGDAAAKAGAGLSDKEATLRALDGRGPIQSDEELFSIIRH